MPALQQPDMRQAAAAEFLQPVPREQLASHSCTSTVEVARILFVHNTSIPQSQTDLDWYITQRSLPITKIGVNFGTTPGALTLDNILGSSAYKVQSGTAFIDGVAQPAREGEAVLTAIQAMCNVDGAALIMSTYTPLTFDPGTYKQPLSGYIAENAGRYTSVMPHGRLGCPASDANNFDFNTEMTARSGTRMFTQAVTNAIAAEATYNKTKALWGTTEDIGAYGFDAAYTTASLVAARAAGAQITVDTATNYPNFFTGPQATAPLLFGLCGPWNLNTAGSPGSQAYSSHYTAMPGAWSAHWWSYQWYWAMDLLYNGGSAAFTSVDEPLSNGCRDPASILAQVLAGARLIDCLPTSATPLASPGVPVNPNYPGRITVLGDPLYAPYRKQTLDPVAACVPF